jgi:FHS family L-fucose permease-like MFS transporter
MENNHKSRLVSLGIIFPFMLITSLFFLWGVANNMTDTLLAAFKRIMSMSDSQTALIQVVFYGAGYGLLAIPAAIFIKKYTYKAGVLLGLGLYSIGAMLFFPAKLTADFYWFLAAIWILSAGLSILETAANPYIISMGSDATGTRRLNLAQSFNPIGSITGILLSQQFILSKLNKANALERAAMNPEKLQAIQNGELNAVTITYVTLGILLIIIWILIATNRKMPKTADAGGPLNFGSTFRRLFRKKHYVWGVIAQFFYVGAQIGVWSFTIRYVMKELRFEEIELPAGKTAEQMAATYYLASLILFTLSRFICTWLMKFITPARLLTVLAGLAVFFTAMVIYAGGIIGVYALVGISGCMSLMFPTIFGLACRGLGEDTKLAGSGLILAIFGGAVFTQLQGVVSDTTGNINLAFWVPLCCFVVIAYYGILARRHALN